MSKKIFLVPLLTAFLLSPPAYSTTIEFDVTNLGGNTWEYTYNVQNDTLGIDIEEFTIFFDLFLYENLAIGLAPAGWDPIVIQPDPGLPDDGFYDALALVIGIAPGDVLGGFSVQFDLLGAGTPGPQPFDVVDPFTFATIDSGTTLSTNSTGVPEPGILILFILGMLPLGWFNTRPAV